jgi:predicted YcjX-like family ATPase
LKASAWIVWAGIGAGNQSGLIDVNGEKIPALRGNRLSDGEPLTVYPGEVPARLPGQAFWQNQGFQFEAFRPQAWMSISPYRISVWMRRWSF